MQHLFLYIERLKKKIKARRGFTLIEAMIGITVLIMAITGPLYVAVKSTLYARYSRDELAATYYGESVLEDIRNNRDRIFIECIYGRPTCTPIDLGGGNYETAPEAAWRIFKTTYAATYFTGSTTKIYVNPTYVTSGKLYTVTPSGAVRFIETTRMTSVPAIPASCPAQYDCTYNDDVRVQTDISYPANGGFRKVTLIDFIRPRF